MRNLKIGVVGSGFMGQEIGFHLVEQGYPILLKARKEQDILKFQEAVRGILKKNKMRGKINQEEFDELLTHTSGTLQFDERFSNLDMVIESVVEDIDVKREVFKDLEKVCPGKTIFCSNTSSLSITEIGEALSNKARLIGLHFTHPVRFFGITEIAPTDKTLEEVIRIVSDLIRDLGKKPLLVKDSPAFFLSRIMLTSYLEVFYALETGQCSIIDIDSIFKGSDFLVGPLYSSDITGLDVILNTVRNINLKIPNRFAVPSILAKMVEMGRLGRKMGKGFYNYEKGNSIDEEMFRVIEAVRSKKRAIADIPFSLEQSRLRIMNEAIYCIDEGIISLDGVENVIKEVPPFCNGLFKFMDNIGLDTIYERLKYFEGIFGKRFLPAPLLVNLVRTGRIGVKKGQGFFAYN